LTIKRLSLSVFFIALTLSIGLVSVNLTLSSYAQNSALSQNGKGDNKVEQLTSPLHSSNQDNQVVSGDSSALSGNNIACQEQANSEDGSGICPEGVISPGPIGILSITTVLRATCGGSFSCPSPDGLVQVFVNGQPYREFEANTHVREGTTQTDIPIIPGMPYSIHAVGAGKSITWEYELGNIQGDCSGRDTCNAVMKLSGDKVTVNFHYCFRHC